jgi:hypothetical protein
MDSSDERLIARAHTIPDAVERLKLTRGVLFEYNDLARSHGFFSTEERIGIPAQEVAIVLPQAIQPAPFDLDADGISESGENYLGVKYELFVPLLVEAIKAQQNQIVELRARLDALAMTVDIFKRRNT